MSKKIPVKQVTEAEFKKLFLSALGYRIEEKPGQTMTDHTCFSIINEKNQYCSTSRCATGYLWNNNELTSEKIKRFHDLCWQDGPSIDKLYFQEQLLQKTGKSYGVTYLVGSKKYAVQICDDEGTHTSNERRAIAVYNCYSKFLNKEQIEIIKKEN